MLVGIAREHKQAPRRQHQRAERLRLSAPPPSAALRGELKGGGGAEGDLIRVGLGGIMRDGNCPRLAAAVLKEEAGSNVAGSRAARVLPER